MSDKKIFRFHNHTFWGGMLFIASIILPMSPRAVPRVNFQMGVPFDLNTIDCIGCNPLIFGHRLNINRATVEHLQSLPQIGPTRAQAIVKLRQERGAFKRVEELDDVKGIGPKILRTLTPFIVLEP